MSNLLPLSTYNLALNPFDPQPCQLEDFPITVRITLAAIDPESVDEKKEPSTLRLLKKSELAFLDSDEDSEEEDSEEDSEDDEESEEEEQEVKEDKKSKKSKNSKKEESEEESEESSSDEDEIDYDIEEDSVEEHVICTLSPETSYQQTLDITITPEEEVYFVVTGSYKIHLTGNYVDHPNDSDEEDYIYGDDSDEYDEEDSDEYDLTPDEDEILSDDAMEYDLDELDNVEDVEGKIEELVEEEQQQNEKKRKAEDVKESKKSKKEKTVKFNKELEQGPTPTKKEQPKKEQPKKEQPKKEQAAPAAAPKKKAQTIAGGVVIEDKTVGSGPVAKKGQKVGVRYIGKLKNGKVFDKNTSGKPFLFGLGKGEVIKGWDVGVAGMAVGGERRIVIPAPMAYGKQKLPGIPANSELTFDVKLLSIK